MKAYEFYKSESILSIAQEGKPFCAIDRNFTDMTSQPSPEDLLCNFFFILGLFKYEMPENKETSEKKEMPENKQTYFLVLVTDIENMGFFNVFRINKFKIVALSNEMDADSKRFSQLLEAGLNQCQMYFSYDYDLTLTLQQQFDGSASRQQFIWNYEAIKCLNSKWKKATCFKEVIGGHFKIKNPFVIISRKSNKNGGCHTWNRGADINGNAANFVENEEIMIIEMNNNKENVENINMNLNNANESSENVKEIVKESSENVKDSNIFAISHIELGGSIPIFWSQYPTMQLSRPFHFGPQDECEKRFNLHFNELIKTYVKTNDQENENKSDTLDCPIVIVSLLSNEGKEEKLNSKYKKLAVEKKIEFTTLDFNSLMKTKGSLSDEISEIAQSFDYSIIINGSIYQCQQIIPRVNCSSCLDRTSVFMEISFQVVFRNGCKFIKESELNDEGIFNDILNIFNKKSIDAHKDLWLDRSDTISREYTMTRGMKTYLIKNDYQNIFNKYEDYAIQIQRFIYSIFCEGKCTDAYNAVLQERNFSKFDDAELFGKIIHFIQLILLFIYLYLFEGHGLAIHTWKEEIKEIINHPHIPDLRDADEFDNNDCIKMRGKK